MKFRNRITKKIVYLSLIVLIIGLLFIAIAGQLRPKSAPKQELPDVPPYPESTLASSNVVIDKSVKIAEKRFVIVYKSNVKASDISTWFRVELPRFGWTLMVPPTDNMMPVQELYFEKGISFLNISLVENQDLKETAITIVLRPGKVREDVEIPLHE